MALSSAERVIIFLAICQPLQMHGDPDCLVNFVKSYQEPGLSREIAVIDWFI